MSRSVFVLDYWNDTTQRSGVRVFKTKAKAEEVEAKLQAGAEKKGWEVWSAIIECEVLE